MKALLDSRFTDSRAALRAPAALYLPIALAALAMVATLPGRTHGLGLITEPLLTDLQLDRVSYATLNLWATLLGAAFCVPCGWLLDRLGTPFVLAGLTLSLGGVVLAMPLLTANSNPLWLLLFLLILFTRGLGQSGLSVASLALLGKTAGKRNGFAVGVYSFLVAIGFTLSFRLIKFALEDWHAGWRELWAGIGWALVGLSAVLALTVRSRENQLDAPNTSSTEGTPLTAALKTPAFWVFALGTSLYGLISSGISLFNQSILAERHFDRDVFLTITAYSPLAGLSANLAGGWLVARWSLRGVLAIALGLLAVALAAFPHVTSLTQVYVYAGILGAAGGLVTVVFFATWATLFGAAHLGQIQGAAQMLTVLASGGGPVLFAASDRHYGSYTPLMHLLAVVAVTFAVAAALVPLPSSPPGAGHADCSSSPR